MKLKSVFFLCSLFFISVSFSQEKKNKKLFTFKINGEISGFQGQKIYLHHKWEDRDYTDSAVVKNNNFLFELKSYEPNMYWFTLSNNIAAQPNAIFFVDKITLTARLNADSLSQAVVEGGQTQKDYLLYRRLQSDYSVKQQELQSEFTLAAQRRDNAAVNKIQLDYQALGNQYLSGLKTFIKEHSKSAVSGYIIYKEFTVPSVPIENAVECLAYLHKSTADTKFTRLASKKVNDLMGTMVGALATDFSQKNPEGNEVKLSDFRGKYVLVDFWASWCRPCRLENPNVVSAYSKYSSKGFTVMGVSLDSNRDQWVQAIQNDKLTWPNVSDLQGGNNAAAILYGIQNIPQNVLVDRDGKIVAKNLRGNALEEKLNELLNKN